MSSPSVLTTTTEGISAAGPIVVSGASGFIGQHLCRYLGASGHEIRGLVRNDPPADHGWSSAVNGDVCEPAAWRQVVRGAEAVVHLAGRAHVVDQVGEDDVYMRINAEGTRIAAEESAKAGVRTFVFVSSVAVFDESETELHDDTLPGPASAYGRSKLMAEQMAFDVARRTGMRVIVLRPPMVYGPGMKGNPLRLFALINRGMPLPLASMRNRRSMLYVGNLVAAIDFALRSHALASGSYLVADRDQTSTPELVRAAAQIMGRTIRVWPCPLFVLYAAARITQPAARFVVHPFTRTNLDRLSKNLVVNPRRLHEAGFQPPFSLVQGLTETAGWYRAAGTRK